MCTCCHNDLRATADSGSGLTKFVWDVPGETGFGDLFEELTAANALVRAYFRATNLVTQKEASASHVFHWMDQGTLQILTDLNGNLAGSYDFDAWGEIVDASGAVSPLAWQGNWGYYQDNIERTWVRARHLDTRRGRWMSQDPLGFPGDLNPYAYATNSPTKLVDPSGEVAPVVVLGAIVGLLALTERSAGIPVRGYRPRPLIFEYPFNQTPIGRAFGAWRDIQGAITGCDPIDGTRLSWPEGIERILGLGRSRRGGLAPTAHRMGPRVIPFDKK
jgi:RHS repeat-associated protein